MRFIRCDVTRNTDSNFPLSNAMLPQLGQFWQQQTGQLGRFCQGQLSSNIAAYCQGTTLLHSKESQETLIRIYIYYIYLQKLYIYYIYLQKLYINYIYVCVCVCPYLIPLIMNALPSDIHSLERNGIPRDAIQIIRELKHPELH